jgi:hypothetical protein
VTKIEHELIQILSRMDDWGVQMDREMGLQFEMLYRSIERLLGRVGLRPDPEFLATKEFMYLKFQEDMAAAAIGVKESDIKKQQDVPVNELFNGRLFD